MPLWGKWLDPVDLESTVEIHMKVRILPRAQYIGVYLLSLIRSRKSKWLHIGSNPISPTKCSDDRTNLIGGVPKRLKGTDLKSVRAVIIPSRGLESHRLLREIYIDTVYIIEIYKEISMLYMLVN